MNTKCKTRFFAQRIFNISIYFSFTSKQSTKWSLLRKIIIIMCFRNKWQIFIRIAHLLIHSFSKNISNKLGLHNWPPSNLLSFSFQLMSVGITLIWAFLLQRNEFFISFHAVRSPTSTMTKWQSFGAKLVNASSMKGWAEFDMNKYIRLPNIHQKQHFFTIVTIRTPAFARYILTSSEIYENQSC